MTEKVEWEVVDEQSAAFDTRPTLKHLMQRLLGPWWRWKVIGAVSLAGLALALLATLAGITVLLMSAVAGVSVGIGKLMQWARGHHGRAHRHNEQWLVRK